MRLHDPWVGKDYQGGLRGSAKTLIISESHYGSGSTKDFTQRVVTELAIAKPYRHFENIRHVVSGMAFPAEPARFWNRVAFANCVQDLMADTTQRPTAEQFEQGTLALRATMMELRPDIVFCFSAITYDHYLPLDIGSGPSFQPFAETGFLWAYPTKENATMLVCRLNHASRLAVSREVWRVYADYCFAKHQELTGS